MAARGLVLFTSFVALSGCGPNTFLSERENDIKASTRAIETARGDGPRAKAYSARGTAYSEKARFSRAVKGISNDEYVRLFDLAIKDLDQAVALSPGDAEMYFNRAQAYYDRGSLDLTESKSGKEWLDAAASDFEKAIEKDPHNSLAFDRLGLTYESNGQADKAIRAYTQEMALDSYGKRRLADAYCNIGFHHQQENDLPAAATAYEKSTEFGVADDKTCPYDPYANSVEIFTTETRQYDKAWEIVRRGVKHGRFIAPDLIARLVKDSGRVY
ncbi:MAG TPA: tetratricopeptide repeat protein [Bryobacteraceae bacterium]|nr:tetratricopeptide repeat protein [Bryobacteraceae bacterium]